MVFSSLFFLFAFLPANLLCYFCCKTVKTRNIILLLFSLVFYAFGEPVYIAILVLMSLFCWLFSRLIDTSHSDREKKLWLAAAVAVCIGAIGYFKYIGFAAESINGLIGADIIAVPQVQLPIGISFYTFQLLTYVIDVYRGDAKPQKNYWNVLLYAALFHQCVAGPIVRYKTIDRELFGKDPRKPQWAKGASRFCAGLAKKALLANPLGALANSLILTDSAIADAAQFAANSELLANLPVAGAWLGLAAYALHIYLDFSAYSDMAIGMGNMLGLHYLENFNYPYISRSVTEFWRRWHMSLGTFFRDYVYIPLGGSRCGFLRSLFNAFVVWALTGLWHGASWNFVLWGLWFFVFLMIERMFLKRVLDKVPLLSNIYLLVVVLLGWVVFRFTNLELGFVLIKSLFGLNGNPLTDFTVGIEFNSHMYLLAVSVIAATPIVRILRFQMERLFCRVRVLNVFWNLIVYSVIPVILLLLSTASLVGDSYNPFIYFQF